MNINHRPQFDTKKIEEFYTEKDGNEVRYVCSTELNIDNLVLDVFYRDTPHPEFGNHYFGLYHNGESLMITNADEIENMEFGMIKSKSSNQWHYSQCRHDFHAVENFFIDGGRAYVRTGGDLQNAEIQTFKVESGKFVAMQNECAQV